MVFFLRARKTWPSPPASPIADCPCERSAATSDLFTRPASTISAASRVSASVTRRPETNSLVLPICASVAGQLLAAAVHERDLVAVAHQFGDGLAARVQQGLVFNGGASEFDYISHCRPSASSHPHITFMFCTA